MFVGCFPAVSFVIDISVVEFALTLFRVERNLDAIVHFEAALAVFLVGT